MARKPKYRAQRAYEQLLDALEKTQELVTSQAFERVKPSDVAILALTAVILLNGTIARMPRHHRTASRRK